MKSLPIYGPVYILGALHLELEELEIIANNATNQRLPERCPFLSGMLQPINSRFRFGMCRFLSDDR